MLGLVSQRAPRGKDGDKTVLLAPHVLQNGIPVRRRSSCVYRVDVACTQRMNAASATR